MIPIMARYRKPRGPRKTWNSTAAEDRIRDYLVRYRKTFDLTQQRMADKMGVHNSTISRYEAGKRGRGGIALLLGLRELLECSADDILDGRAEIGEAPVFEPTPRRPDGSGRSRRV